MTKAEIRALSRRYANTNDTRYSDTDIDISINAFYDEVSSDLITNMDGWDSFGEVSTTSLVADQQEYCVPADAIWVKRLEVTYDGTTWQPVTFFDINERKTATNTTKIAQDFSVDKPFVDLHDDGAFLYPIPTADVTNGLKLWYIKLPTQLSETTDQPEFIRIFHKLLCYGASKDFLLQYITEKGNVDRLEQCKMEILSLTAKMKKIYNKHNQDRAYAAHGAYIDYN